MAVYRPLAMCLRLKALREGGGMSQQDVAERLHMSQAAYSRMESGETEMTVGRLMRIASLYDVDVALLLKDL